MSQTTRELEVVTLAKEWGWLKGGIALGLLSAFAFITYKPLGVSTSYPRSVALLLNQFFPEFVAENAYFQTVPPVVDWQLMLVLGIIVGGFIASRVVRRAATVEAASCEVPVKANQPAQSDGGQPVSSRRKWMAFFGGFLILFGARLAGGCTSGHVITGMTQLATASFIFAASVFAVGIPTAMFAKRKGWV